MGHHFSNGFIWASQGGGWEYPVLWTVLIISFAFFGAGDFSLDRSLKNRFNIPLWIKHLMGGRSY
jgi:putative oxidoreductase